MTPDALSLFVIDKVVNKHAEYIRADIHMRIFNEVGRWYSIPCKILTQVIYVKKKF